MSVTGTFFGDCALLHADLPIGDGEMSHPADATDLVQSAQRHRAFGALLAVLHILLLSSRRPHCRFVRLRLLIDGDPPIRAVQLRGGVS